MSKHAIQAVLAAVVENPELKARILNPETMPAAVAEVLALTAEEEQEVMGILNSQDAAAAVAEPIESRETPGPGVGGGGRFM